VTIDRALRMDLIAYGRDVHPTATFDVQLAGAKYLIGCVVSASEMDGHVGNV
jgi:hypothetical protein